MGSAPEMKRRAALVVLCTAASVLSSRAMAQAKACKDVTGTTTGAFVSEGCESPVGLCTAGMLRSGWGGLRGTFELVVTEIAPCGEGLMCYEGILTLTTPAGTLTLLDAGVINTADGTFSDTATFISGTGLFSDGDAELSFTGVITNGTLSSSFTGTVCKR